MRLLMIAAALASGLLVGSAEAAPGAEAAPKPSTGFANGQKNWIIAAGAARAGSTFTFREVQIEGNGFVVIYQILNGRPVGEKYLGAGYVASGNSKNVTVTVNYEPRKGEHFLVMLHRDVNEDKVFDFEFVNPPDVLDKVVSEGNKMVARIFTAP